MSEPYITEIQFEQHIRRLIDNQITAIHPHIYALDNKKAVDILVCRDGSNPALFFIEVKFHRLSHGRLGFGSGGGGGFQPEILTRLPAYFSKNLRWILASEQHPGEILLLTCDEAKGYVSGGSIGSKFNNFQRRLWRDAPRLAEDVLADKLLDWFLEV